MKIVSALLLSLGFHALLAGVLAVAIGLSDGPRTLATLDLSSVELSFAEDDVEKAAVAPVLPQMASKEFSHVTPARPEVPPEENFAHAQPSVRPPDPADRPLAAPKPEAAKMPEDASVPPAPAVSQVAPRQARVDAPPRPTRAIRPDYPRSARQRGEQGDVVLEIVVAASGAVDSVRVVRSCGFADLDAAAVRAASAAQFQPARSKGAVVASSARLTLSFKLK